MLQPPARPRLPVWSATQPTTLVDVLQWRALHEPDRTAHVFLPDAEGADLRRTYRELDQRARVIATALRRLAQPGDRAVLLYPAGLDFIEAFFGCLYAGVVAVPAYPPRNQGHLPRLRALVADAGAVLGLSNARTLESIRKQTAGLPEWTALAWLATDTETAEPDASAAWPAPASDSLAFLQYTSGSTGAPKGVMVTHANIVYNTHYIQESFRLHPASVSVSWLPAFHDMGLIDGVLGPVYTGHLGVLMSPVSFIQRPARWLEAITRFRGTHGGGPNFGYDLCVEKISAETKVTLDLSSWESAYNGAEPVRAATLRAFSAAFAGCGFRPESHYPCFGMAETTLMVTGGDPTIAPVVCTVDRTALEAGRFEPAAAGASAATTFDLVSSGRAILDTRVAIVDPERSVRVAPGVIGEVWVAGPTLCAGYWQRPEVTAATFRARLAGEGATPWLRTGDLGYLDAAGELFICGRAKDLIIIRGRNHYPQDIEATAERAHPALKSGGGAAFSVEVDGIEQLVVVQELQRTALRQANVAEIGAAIARAVLEAHEVQVHAVVLLKTGTVPKTSSGKIQRQTARRLYLASELESVGAWQPAAAPSAATMSAAPASNPSVPAERTAGELTTWLRARVAALVKCAPDQIDLHAPFSAYGLDSATLVALSGELQDYLGRSVPPMLLYDHPDIARLVAQLATSGPAATPGRPAAPAGLDEPIAIVGLGLRFPGGASDPQAFWRLLRDGVDAITEVPTDRFPIDAVYAADAATPGRTNSRHGGFLAGIEGLDAEFFGIAPREAVAMDPQQRLLLEVAWHALEDAAIDPRSLNGSDTGVFVGISTQDYAQRALPAGDLGRIDAYGGTGNALSAAAGRLAYVFGFEGPALAIDTACSSSLVAVHQACQALRLGECSLALAGGVNVILEPTLAVNFAQARMLAPDGRCKAFAEGADGYVRSEGCGLVVLKRLSAALADEDPIVGVIRGSAVNQDGRSNGLTAPNGPAQERVVRAALARARLAPADLGYVEAHGTGTALGDPIEVQALARALGPGRPADTPLLLGSVKSNLGHLEAAAGIASLIKTVLALRAGEVPPSLHCAKLNRHVPWSSLPLRVVTTRTPWPEKVPRRAGVSSFGFTGTNAHVIVEAAPPEPAPSEPAEGGPRLVALSAESPTALAALVTTTAAAVAAAPEVPVVDWARSLNARASFDRARISVVASTPRELADVLARRGAVPVAVAPRSQRVGFLFTGQGSQYARMGQTLYASEPVYRAALDRCAAVLDPLLPAPLLSVLHAEPGTETARRLDETLFTQPALFAVEWALTELWRSWGLVPAAVTGHSVGEFVAATVAGVFSLEDGLRLIAARGRLMQALPAGGGMMAVFADLATAQSARVGHDQVAVAAVNSPAETVLAGPLADLAAIGRALAERGIESRPLAVSHAFHSPLMEPMRAEFDRVLATVRFAPPKLPVISNLGPGADLASPAHWRAHVTGTVRFAEGLGLLAAQGVTALLEIGPRPVLSGLVRRNGIDSLPVVHSLRPQRDDRATILAAAGELYEGGASLRPSAIGAHCGRRRAGLGLPGYPFQRQRHWLERSTAVGASADLPRTVPVPTAPPKVELGVMFFNGTERAEDRNKYRLVLEAARFADRHGFSSVWVPERHYTRFGGLYPNPTVLAAALARETRSVRLMAGSLVAPLHPPLRIAEDWSVIDNLSGGRVGLSFASGWNPQDFAVAPDAYADRHEQVFRTLADVRRLWSGGTIPARLPDGRESAVRIYPTPLQRELPAWVTAAGNPRTFERAGEVGANLLTHLLDQEPEQLAEKIARYRAARAHAGHDPATGRVSVMLHTFVGPDDDTVRAKIRAPYIAFLQENLHLLQGLAISRGRSGADPAQLSPEDRTEFAGLLFDRFYARRALFGTVEACVQLIDRLSSAGVNEIACLLDFGAADDDVLAALPYLDAVRARLAGQPTAIANVDLPRGVGTPPAPTPPPAKAVGGGDLRAPADRIEDVLHTVAWRELPGTNGTRSLAGTWLIFDDGESLGAQLAERLAIRGARPIRVQPGESFVAVDAQTYRIDPRCAADFTALLAAIRGPLGGVVHAWTLAVPDRADMTAATIEAGLTLGPASLLQLAQALIQADRPAPIWVVTRAAEGAVPVGARTVIPARAPVRGLARVLAVEHPALWGGLLDLDATPTSDEAARIVARITAADGEDVVVWRDGPRAFAPRVRPERSIPATEPVAFRASVTYYVTGGLGAMGRSLAAWLVARGARHLVLSGREAAEKLSPVKVQALAALRAQGATVRYVSLDAANEDAQRSLLTEIAASGAPLAGVFHLAGLPENRSLQETRFDRDRGVFDAKLHGALILHRLTQGLPLDHFVTFSSITVVWGARGQPLYAAANQFLDALADHRRQAGLPATVINWGPWSEGGMVAGDDRAQLARIGLHAMTPSAGLSVLEHALASGRSGLIAAAIDWPVFKDVFAARGRQRLFAEVEAPPLPALAGEPTPLWRELSGYSSQARHARLTDWLQTAVARTLRWPDDQRPGAERGFFELGMDSLMAIEIKNRLQAELGVPLRATVVFNYPNIAALTDYLASLLPAPPAAPAAGADLADLSADELAGLLEQELKAIDTQGRKGAAS